MTSVKHVLIVGGGIAGLTCAQKLAHRKDIHVTLLDAHNYFQFKPLLYQVATSELGLSDIATSLRSLFRKKTTVDVKLEEVVSMDPKSMSVFTQDGKHFSGDSIVLACGSQPNFFNVAGAENAFPLYTFEDARRLRCQILSAFERADSNPELIEKGLLNFVIVGAGSTGTEMAGGLSDVILGGLRNEFSDVVVQKAKVYLVDFLPEVLMPFSKNTRQYAEKELLKRNVQLVLNKAVQKIFPDHLLLSDGSEIQTSTVIWAGGIKPVSLIEKSGLPLGKGSRVETEKDLSVKGFPLIYAIGDCANIQDRDGSFLPQLGSVAKQCGECAAANIIRTVEGFPKKPFSYFDKGIMAMIGQKSAVANIGRRKIELTGFFASVAWSLVHAVLLPTFRQTIETIFKWVWQYFTKTPALQLIDKDVFMNENLKKEKK